MKIFHSFILILVIFFLSLHTVFAHQPEPISHTFTVTAVVPISPVWEAAIRENSQVMVSAVKENDLQFSSHIVGLNNAVMPKETVRAILIKGESPVSILESTTDNQGVAHFHIHLNDPGVYQVKFFYTFGDQQVLLSKELSFIQEVM